VSADILPVVVETPRGSRTKMAYDFELGMLRLSKELPAGFEFPFHFGAVPCTIGGDGDPLDVILLGCDDPAAGSLVAARLIGVLEARVTKGKRSERNDRALAVATKSRRHRVLTSVKDVPAEAREEIEKFFEDYSARTRKRFEVIGWFGPKRAATLLRTAREQYSHSRNGTPGRGFADYVKALRD
jgi:inorganic pyrophosphatase